jgi:choline kinase
MVEIEGISLIDRQIEVLQSEGVQDIVMVGGYKHDKLRKYNVKHVVNNRFYETNMVYTLFCAEQYIHDETLICYGDIVYSRNILRQILNSTEDISTTIDMNWESYWNSRNEDPLSDAETLRLDQDGYIYEIGKKPDSLSEIEGQYMGLIKLSDSGAMYLKSTYHGTSNNKKKNQKEIDNMYMTDLLQMVIDSGRKVKAVPIVDDWIEVDTVEDLNLDITINRARNIRKSIYNEVLN